MSLPSSGQISFNDVRTEMSQSAMSNYDIVSWGRGYGTYYWSENPQFTPINVHGDNSGKYNTSGVDFNMNQYHGYNRSSNYASDGTLRDLFFSVSPAAICFPSSMLVFDAGTSNTTLDLYISGSADDFAYVSSVAMWYGKPWQSNGDGLGTAELIYDNFSLGSGLNHTENYNYTYDSNKGQYVYIVIYGNCP